MTSQAIFLNEVISVVLHFYSLKATPPTTVVLIGHSLGGVVCFLLHDIVVINRHFFIKIFIFFIKIFLILFLHKNIYFLHKDISFSFKLNSIKISRMAVTLPNYVPNSVRTIITLSTPHTGVCEILKCEK
jgi:triacylglycerol esterase/lipase EstA (alpha/beta hydrolase family)